MEWERSKEIERELFLSKGKFSYSCVLLRFGNALGRMHEYGNFPYNKKPYSAQGLSAFYPNSLG